MNEISRLQIEVERCDAELQALRDELDPAEEAQHQGLKELEATRLETFERLAWLLAKVRDEDGIGPEQLAYADYFRAVQSGDRERDAELERDLRAEVRRAAPTSTDDPRLAAWYHTIELGNGLRSTGRYDLRSCVDSHGLPASLEGKTCLDVGTCDGFWAFEMERRGADRVVAMDIEWMADFDYLPSARETLDPLLMRRLDHHFWLSHALLDSRVEHTLRSVYELSPETVGTFDFVFCGSLLVHLQNPLKALLNMRAVTGERAVVATQLSEISERFAPERPLVEFGNRQSDAYGSEPLLGVTCVYWKFGTKGLQEIMEYAGFGRTEALDPVSLPPAGGRCAVVVGYP